MLGELLITSGVMATTYTCINHKSFFKNLCKKNKIQNAWNNCMRNTNNEYEINNIFIKYYGFDAIISIPNSKSIKDLRNLIPILSIVYKGEVIIELSQNKTSGYMRVHDNATLKDKDNIRFKWYQTFSDSNKVRNNIGETFNIDDIKDIYNPNTDKSIVGYKLEISIPNGLSYDDLKKYETNLNNVLGKCSIDWDSKRLKAIITIITVPLSNDEKFSIVKCKPYELYVAMGYDYSPILCDFKVNGNLMLGGKNNTGKTRAEIQAMVNLCCQYTDNDIELYIGYTTYKTDLRIFKDLKQTKTYVTSLDELLNLFKFLNKQAEKRNKIFTECDGFITNIYEYNDYAKKHKLKKMPIMYFITDEIADFMPNDYDSKSIKEIKKMCNGLFWQIARLGRSAGIYELMSSQRMSKENVSAETKSQMGTKICFYQSNTASALTVFGLGDECAYKITHLEKQRECLIDNQDGITIGKTLFLSNDMMLDLLKDSIEKDKKYIKIDDNGNIINENTQKLIKNDKKTTKIPRFKQNLYKKQQKFDI